MIRLLLRAASVIGIMGFSTSLFAARASKELLPSFLNMEANIEFDQARFSVDEKTQRLSGNVVISIGDLNLRTADAAYCLSNQQIQILAPAELNYSVLRLIMEKADFSGETQTITAKNFRGGTGPIFFSGAEIQGSPQKIHLKESAIYFCEPHWSALSFDFSSLEYFKESDEFNLSSPVLRIAGAPILAFPPMTLPRIERPPVRISAHTGSDSSAGIYLRTTEYLTLWNEFEPGILLDLYERSGLLFGPAGTFNLGNDERWLKAEFQTAYINDTASREDDIYGEKIGGNRGFVEWKHKQQIDALEISSSLYYWSDSEVIRNFRPERYDENQNPDSYIEFVLPDERFYVSALTRFHLNEYQNVQQRLPEIRIDFQPKEILETGIFQQLSASYALLREKDSAQYPLVLQNHGNDELESSRADVYYGLSAPIGYGDFFGFTPIVGARLTYYGHSQYDRNDDYTRVLGQIGFDMHFLLSGKTEFSNKIWGIDGLRHILRPVISYRYLPGTAEQSGKIPQIDREVYLSAPAILDLAENRAIDQIYDEQIFRFGFENLFQTRDAEYGSRTLVEFNVYQDLRKTYRPQDNKTWSHNFTEIKIFPADWISVFARHRMDVYKFETRALTAGIVLNDADLWELDFSYTYVDDELREYYGYETDIRQFRIGGTYKLNSYFALSASWHFNDLTNTLTEQYYGLQQRLGNSWNVQYYIRYRKEARDDNDFSVGVSLRLSTF